MRFELMTFRVWTGCSNQLSYRALVERMGIEPTTPCVQGRCSSQVSYPPNGEEDRIWTCDHYVPNVALYQAELLLHDMLSNYTKKVIRKNTFWCLFLFFYICFNSLFVLRAFGCWTLLRLLSKLLCHLFDLIKFSFKFTYFFFLHKFF